MVLVVGVVNGPSLPLEESYHPNDAGNAAYASLVTGTSGFSALGRPGAATTAAPESYARVLPDLASEQNIARAERAGISAALIRRLDADLRSEHRQRGKAAVLKLQRWTPPRRPGRAEASEVADG